MNFGFSISDFITVPAFAWKVYKLCKDSSDDFKNISGEVASLHIVLKETEEHLSLYQLDPDREAQLNSLGKGCHDVLKDLESLLDRYQSLGTNTQRTWDRMRWGLEDISALRERLTLNTATLAAFNTTLINSSQARIEKKLNKLLAEIRAGKREGSVVSTETIESLSMDDKEAWRQLRRELEDIGISVALLTEHRQFIIDWFKEAVEAGAWEERAPELPADTLARWEEIHLAAASSQVPTSQNRAAEVVTTNKRLQPLHRKRGKPLRLQPSYLIFKLFQSDAALHHAASNGDMKRVNKLLSFDIYINCLDKDGGTALHVAARKGHEAVLRLLLDKGADIEAKMKGKWGGGGEYEEMTALHVAAEKGHEAVARLLLDKGADIEAKIKGKSGSGGEDEEMTALHVAAEKGHEAVARLLLDKGADIEAKMKGKSGGGGEYEEITALHVAAGEEHEAVARLLLDKGADVEAKIKWKPDEGSEYGELTALHLVAKGGHEAVAQLLLDNGADVEAKAKMKSDDGDDFEELTALHVAVEDGNKEIVQLLLNKGADIDAKAKGKLNGDDEYERLTALHMAARKGQKEIAQLLLKKGADVWAEGGNGRTALYWATKNAHVELVRLLSPHT